MSTETRLVNVYRVFFYQGPEAVEHEAIALVLAEYEYQGRGTFFHVKGHAAYGMDYEMRDLYDFEGSRSYLRQERQFCINSSSVSSFQAICEAIEPPIDERAQEQGVKAEVDCRTWVAEVLKKASSLAV